MTTGSMERSIGRIEGQLEALVKAVSEMSKHSDDSRSRMYVKIEEIDKKVTLANATIEDLDLRISKVEPVIDDVSKWRERAIGARMTVTIFVASIGGGCAFAAQWLWTHFAGKSG